MAPKNNTLTILDLLATAMTSKVSVWPDAWKDSEKNWNGLSIGQVMAVTRTVLNKGFTYEDGDHGWIPGYVDPVAQDDGFNRHRQHHAARTALAKLGATPENLDEALSYAKKAKNLKTSPGTIRSSFLVKLLGKEMAQEVMNQNGWEIQAKAPTEKVVATEALPEKAGPKSAAVDIDKVFALVDELVAQGIPVEKAREIAKKALG